MANNRSLLIVSILLATLSLFGSFVLNIASSNLPESWKPYIWFAYPLAGPIVVLTIIFVHWPWRITVLRENFLNPIVDSQKADAIFNAPGRITTVVQQVVNPIESAPEVHAISQFMPQQIEINSPVDSANKVGFKYDVFISYSHKDEEWKERLVTHLRVLQMQDMINVWDDRRIEAGDEWRSEIEKAINRASIAILMISANFLSSKFILDNEVPKLLERRKRGGLRVIPLIVKSCAWKQVEWLSEIQGRPKDNQPLSSGSDHQIDSNLAALAEEIADILKG